MAANGDCRTKKEPYKLPKSAPLCGRDFCQNTDHSRETTGGAALKLVLLIYFFRDTCALTGALCSLMA